MNRLIEEIRALQAIERQRQALLERKLELEKQARVTSRDVTGRARRLMTDAVLRLLARNVAVDAANLGQEVSRLAGNGDGFAAALCDDWLEEAANAGPSSLE